MSRCSAVRNYAIVIGITSVLCLQLTVNAGEVSRLSAREALVGLQKRGYAIVFSTDVVPPDLYIDLDLSDLTVQSVRRALGDAGLDLVPLGELLLVTKPVRGVSRERRDRIRGCEGCCAVGGPFGIRHCGRHIGGGEYVKRSARHRPILNPAGYGQGGGGWRVCGRGAPATAAIAACSQHRATPCDRPQAPVVANALMVLIS